MKVFITGAAGFIGFHLSNLLLNAGHTVKGFDGLTDYYDPNLKKARLDILRANEEFSFTAAMLEEDEAVATSVADFEPDVIVHLAAQAGVRYSLTNPRAYIDSNVIGTLNILEAAKTQEITHLLMASTSSVYGANDKMPFVETEKADAQLTVYAATKKANESMAHAYSHLWKIPITMFRFFTVYGPWGRPDMALFKFVKAALADEAIDVYNYGEMYRDFTFVGDLVKAIQLLIDIVPGVEPIRGEGVRDSLSGAAPFRVVNIGNSDKVRLLDYISAMESALGITVKQNLLPMQMGDVPATWADCSLLKALTGYAPNTPCDIGVEEFVEWYRSYYGV